MEQFLFQNQWVILLAFLWTIPWKGIALWRAVKNDHKKWRKIEAILTIYRRLLRLSWKPEVDLSVFEKSAQRVVAEIFQESWKPRVVDHPDFSGRKVWCVI